MCPQVIASLQDTPGEKAAAPTASDGLETDL
jgi:hypothetical protein